MRPLAALAGLSLAALVALPADTAKAGGVKDNVSLSYDVYSGSLRLFKISLGMEIDDASYAVRAAIKSKGLVSLFAKTKINMRAQGKTRRNTIKPSRYTSSAKSKGKKKNVKISWSKKGLHKVKRDFNLSAYKSKRLARAVKPGWRSTRCQKEYL